VIDKRGDIEMATPVCKSCKRQAINREQAKEDDFIKIEESAFETGTKCNDHSYEPASHVWV
jgi:hypothetical protein